MQQFRLFKLLLRPSLLSGIGASLASLLVLGIGNWIYVSHTTFFDAYLFGKFGLVTSLQQSQGDLLPVVFGIFDKPFTYNIMVLLVAAICGVLVYISLESVTRSVDSVHETWEEIHYSSGNSRKLVEIELGTRWVIRISAIIGWIIYWILWLSVVLPFCLLVTRPLFGEVMAIENWLYAALGLIVCIIGFHLHVVFIRLIMLRPRVFGGRAALELEAYNQH